VTVFEEEHPMEKGMMKEREEVEERERI